MTGADPIVVSGIGAVCAVGHTAPISFTSMKAGLSRIRESPELRIRDAKGKLVPVVCAAAAGVTDGQRRYLRLYRLAVRAFAEVVVQAQLDERVLQDSAVHLALPEAERPGLDDDRHETQLMHKIGQSLQVGDLMPRTRVFPVGHAGAFAALEEAARSITEGRCATVVVGGVDSYLDEFTLMWLQDSQRLKSEANPKGFVPGEGAAFLVVERQSAAQARNVRPYARVTGVAQALEPNSIYDKAACRGDGLTQAIRGAQEAATDLAPVSRVLCDLNGERYRANEWGLALARCFNDGTPPGPTWHPADVLGDAGAAAGALNLVFATAAVARQGHDHGQALVWGSSDDGERGAALLAAARMTAHDEHEGRR